MGRSTAAQLFGDTVVQKIVSSIIAVLLATTAFMLKVHFEAFERRLDVFIAETTKRIEQNREINEKQSALLERLSNDMKRLVDEYWPAKEQNLLNTRRIEQLERSVDKMATGLMELDKRLQPLFLNPPPPR